MTSTKYPGWQIEKDAPCGRGYTMTNPQTPMFAVDVLPTRDGGWVAELLTRRFDRFSNSYSFEPARNSFTSYTVADVCAEAVRRTQYWATRKVA